MLVFLRAIFVEGESRAEKMQRRLVQFCFDVAGIGIASLEQLCLSAFPASSRTRD